MQAHSSQRGPMQAHEGPQPPTTANAGQRRLTAANEGQRRPTTANAGQRRLTAANEGQRRPTTANAGQRRPTAANEGQRRPTKAHSANDGQRRPTQAHEDKKGPKRRQTRCLGHRFFLLGSRCEPRVCFIFILFFYFTNYFVLATDQQRQWQHPQLHHTAQLSPGPETHLGPWLFFFVLILFLFSSQDASRASVFTCFFLSFFVFKMGLFVFSFSFFF